MFSYKEKNPALKADIFQSAEAVGSQTMTIQGTVNKIALLGVITFVSAMYTWNLFMSSGNPASIQGFMYGGFGIGFILALIIVFKKKWANVLAPIYCIAKGLALGGISAVYEVAFQGIVFQALMLTFGILFSLLLIYRMRWIAVTENFKLMIGSAIMGIGVLYLSSFVLGFFGVGMTFLHDSSPLSVGISLVIVAVAAFSLVIDFDFIEEGEENGAPKYMEWYAAFGLIVTLIWLYIEILRLLSKLRD